DVGQRRLWGVVIVSRVDCGEGYVAGRDRDLTGREQSHGQSVGVLLLEKVGVVVDNLDGFTLDRRDGVIPRVRAAKREGIALTVGEVRWVRVRPFRVVGLVVPIEGLRSAHVAHRGGFSWRARVPGHELCARNSVSRRGFAPAGA